MKKAPNEPVKNPDRTAGAVLFLLVLFITALVIAAIQSEITPALLTCLTGGLLAMLFVIFKKANKTKKDPANSEEDSASNRN